MFMFREKFFAFILIGAFLSACNQQPAALTPLTPSQDARVGYYCQHWDEALRVKYLVCNHDPGNRDCYAADAAILMVRLAASGFELIPFPGMTARSDEACRKPSPDPKDLSEREYKLKY